MCLSQYSPPLYELNSVWGVFKLLSLCFFFILFCYVSSLQCDP